MPNPEEPIPLFDPEGDESGYVGSPDEQTPGHTPGTAEGEDEDAPYPRQPNPDPDKTPGKAEG
ncbi:MAG: hypothetical protein ACJ790_20435 [Myxococcaceae bacterium]